MSVHRSRRSRSHKRPRATSGIDLPEVAPVTGLEASPAERLSHVPPQHVPLRYVSGIEAVHVDDGKEAAVTVEPDDNASTRGFFPSPSKPNIVEKQPFWKNKKARKWFLAAAFVFAILLAVVITVAVTQSMSGHSSPSATIQTVTASASPLPSSKTSATTSTISGCPTYTGPALTSLPSSITRAGSPAPTPADSNKIATIHFSQGFTYDEASNNDTQTQNAFISIPQGLAYAASGSSSSEFIINTFTPIDTTPQQCFIAMQAKLNLPERYVAALQSQVTASRTDPSVLLWNNPNGNTAALFDTILNINF